MSNRAKKSSKSNPEISYSPRQERTSLKCGNYFERFDYAINNNPLYNKILLMIIGGFILIFFILMIITIDWTYFNMFFAFILIGIMLIYGKMGINKQIAVIILLLIFITFIMYFILYNTANHHIFYPYIDPIIHFNMGWVLYHCFRSLFPKQNKWLSLVYSMLFEIVYEIIEYTYGFIMNTWLYTDPLEIVNMIQDVCTNLGGGLFGLAIEVFLFTSNCPPTKQK